MFKNIKFYEFQICCDCHCMNSVVSAKFFSSMRCSIQFHSCFFRNEFTLENGIKISWSFLFENPVFFNIFQRRFKNRGYTVPLFNNIQCISRIVDRFRKQGKDQKHVFKKVQCQNILKLKTVLTRHTKYKCFFLAKFWKNL